MNVSSRVVSFPESPRITYFPEAQRFILGEDGWGTPRYPKALVVGEMKEQDDNTQLLAIPLMTIEQSHSTYNGNTRTVYENGFKRFDQQA